MTTFIKEYGTALAIVASAVCIIGYNVYSHNTLSDEIHNVETALSDKIHAVDVKVEKLDVHVTHLEQEVSDLGDRVTAIEHHLYGRDFNQKATIPSDHVTLADQTEP